MSNSIVPSASVNPSTIPVAALFADSKIIPFAEPTKAPAALSKSLFLIASIKLTPPAAARPITPVANPSYVALVVFFTFGGKYKATESVILVVVLYEAAKLF